MGHTQPFQVTSIIRDLIVSLIFFFKAPTTNGCAIATFFHAVLRTFNCLLVGSVKSEGSDYKVDNLQEFNYLQLIISTFSQITSIHQRNEFRKMSSRPVPVDYLPCLGGFSEYRISNMVV